MDWPAEAASQAGAVPTDDVGRRGWFARYGLAAVLLGVAAAAAAVCLAHWVPIQVRWHLRRLAGNDELNRSQARAALVRLGTAAVPTLARSAHHADPRVRLGVAQVLGEIGTGEALRPLVPLLGDSDEAVRRAAAWVLLAEGAVLRESAPDLAFDHPDPVVRLCAIHLSRRRGLVAAMDRLIDALDDPESLVRQAAARELGERTGRDFAYDAFADEPSRRAGAGRWRAWWAEEQRRLPMGQRTPGAWTALA